jgi:hypothetical protein
MLFRGSREQLAALVDQLGIPCRWDYKGAWMLCTFDDGVSNLKLNWWPHSGELRLVGDPEVRLDVQRRLEELLPG